MIFRDTIALGFPNTIVGIGVVKDTGVIVKKLGTRNALIVTDQGIVQAGLLEQPVKSLKSNGINFEVFDKCEPDAPVANILDCARTAKEVRHDLLIGIGGGSTMDITKTAAILAVEDEVSLENISKYISTGVSGRGIPTILIPTTAGTGSEVSLAALITDIDGCKKSILSNNLFPETAIVDPMMSLNLPAKITADSGMDALSHAFEGYLNTNANFFSEMLAEKVIKLVMENLRSAYHNGANDMEARYNMAVAASMGSISMSAARGGTLIHGMGYVIQMEVKCTHAESCTVMIPHVLEFNSRNNLEKLGRIAEILGHEISHLSPEVTANKVIEEINRLATDLNMPQRLIEIGITEANIARMTEHLFTYCPNHIKNNSRICSKEDAVDIFKVAL